MTPDLKFSLGLAVTGIAVFAIVMIWVLVMGQIWMEMPR
jgi:hypothetical protein